jgi:acetyl-CoA synthetase
MNQPTGPVLDAYQFYQREWDSYEQLRDDFEWEVPETFNIATYVCDRWAADHDRVAIFGERADGTEETVTFSDFRNRANRLANLLAAHGVGPGDRVGVNTPQKPETAIAHVAIWKLGAVSVPLSTLFGPEALGYRLRDAGATAIVVDETNVDTLRAVRSDCEDLEAVVTVGAESRADEVPFRASLSAYSRTFETADTDAEDDATIIYTSGTTGPPKGVVHAHRVVLGHLPGFVVGHCGLDIRDSDVIWSPAEWAWVATVFGTMTSALYYGMPVVASQENGPFEPHRAFELVERYGVSILFAPPTALRKMMQVPNPTRQYDLDSVRVLFSGGESLDDRAATWAAETFDGATIQEVYGQTEANITISECPALFPSRDGSLGRPVPGHRVRLVDPDDPETTVEAGTVGEIAIDAQGDPVCLERYWNAPAKTDRTLRDGWLLTGDLATQNADGYVSFVGRKDDVIISSGYRIGPEEIERTLVGHDAVADAGVVGVDHDVRGEVPKAFVVVADRYDPSPELRADLQQYVKETLSKHAYPRELALVDELPRTVTGKLRRTALREREDGS